ncbi:MAG: V-type ATP synthase subunit E family protein [Candidatus Omnitrophica bacterium]|nr:V-type ATP synthase subunit E family protein [Candidatus Omnitrophota bacterium]MDD5351649.1 V-type ATP synthase subunit E family protein [Candidatus Omnitrophota bacterium]MDD5550859.1 V-type ATP synthase subunit E family protein [Candidatus Omnitrophota bacterium]
MSLESILDHIFNAAEAQKQRIIQEAQKEKDGIIQEAKNEADSLYQEIIARAKTDCENQRQRLIVSARLKVRKNLLSAKQELIEAVFNKLKSSLHAGKLKKKQISADGIKEVPEDIDFYLGQLRQDFETQITDILFK